MAAANHRLSGESVKKSYENGREISGISVISGVAASGSRNVAAAGVIARNDVTIVAK